MIRVVNAVEKNVKDRKEAAINVPTGVSTEVIPDTTKTSDEYVNIEIFNNGPNNAYYAFGRACDNLANFNAYVVPGQMLEVNTRESVNCYCPVGSALISITKLVRQGALSNNS